MMEIISCILYVLVFCFFPIFCGVFNIYQLNFCKKKIKGKFIDVVETRIKYTTVFSPVFKYELNGINYKNSSSQSFSKEYIDEYLKKDLYYDIYINEKNPNLFILEKEKNIGNYIVICMGLFFIGLFFFMI